MLCQPHLHLPSLACISHLNWAFQVIWVFFSRPRASVRTTVCFEDISRMVLAILLAGQTCLGWTRFGRSPQTDWSGRGCTGNVWQKRLLKHILNLIHNMIVQLNIELKVNMNEQVEGLFNIPISSEPISFLALNHWPIWAFIKFEQLHHLNI